MKKSNIIKKSISYLLSAAMLLSLNGGIGVFADSSFSDSEILDADIPSYIEKETINGEEWLVFDSGQDMEWLRNHVLNKEDGEYSGGYYCRHNIILKNDIDMKDYNGSNNNAQYSGIGWGQQWIGFAGKFDGDGHSIYNLNVYTDTPVGPKGLLFNITKDATIRNVAVSGELTANRYIGGLIGRTTGSVTIENVVVNGKLRLENANSNSIGGVIGQCGSGQTVGGDKIIIRNTAVVGSCVSATSTNPAGGLIGHVYGGYDVNIENSYAASDLECQGGSVAGLIAGQGTGTLRITNSYYKNTMADTSIIVMNNNGDASPIGPDSSFVSVKAVSDEYMKSDDFVNDLGTAFKKDLETPIANGYPIPKSINAEEHEFTGFVWSGEPKLIYAAGEKFDIGTLTAKATYGSKDYDATITVSNTDELSLNDKTITVTASFNGQTESKTYDLTVKKLIKLEVTTPPNKITYYEGEKFDATDMVVTGTFEDENGEQNTEEITDYKYSPDTALTSDDFMIRIQYLNKSIAYNIDVQKRYVDRIEIGKKPANLLYAADENFDFSDMEVYVYYKDAPMFKVKLQYTSGQSGNGMYTYKVIGNTVNVEYTDKGVTYTQSFDVTRLASNKPEFVDNVCMLETADDMAWFANQVNGCNKSYDAKLVNDIDLSNSTSFKPIGYGYPNLANSYTSAVFDGNGKKIILNMITELDVNDIGYTGLFGRVNNSVIKNITVEGNIIAKGKDFSIGGVVAGSFDGTVIENCINKCNIQASNEKSTAKIGGIVGSIGANDKVVNCINYANIDVSNFSGVGGICGQASAFKKNMYIEKCSNWGNINGKSNVGGLIGIMSSLSHVSDCYSKGNITGTSSVGGLIGLIKSADNKSIEQSYFVGSVKQSNDDVSYGIFGTLEAKPNINISHVYYINNISNSYPEAAANNVSADDVSSKTSDELKSADILETLGKAYTLVHSESVGNEGYPVLKWQITDEMHTWDEGTVTKEATTEEEGEKTYKCTDPACDATKTEAIAKIEKPNNGGGSSSGGGSASTVQKSTVTAGEGGKTSLSANGSTLTITPDAGYEISKVTLNGTDKGTVSSLTGLKTGDKVTVAFVKKADNVVKVTYKDVAGSDWFNDAVNYVTEKGLMSGTGDSLFSPNADTTRGMLMTILARMSGTDTASSSPWYQKGLDWAVSKGISDGTAPEMLITREQLATMLYRYAGSPDTTGSINRFSDADQVSGYALNAVKWAVEKGVISGNGNAVTLDPKGYATRAQMATMMMRYCELPA